MTDAQDINWPDGYETPPDGSKSAVDAVVMPSPNDVVVARFKDDCMGDGDIYHVFAMVDASGIWFTDCGRKLIAHEGDEVLEWWPIKPGTGNKVA